MLRRELMRCQEEQREVKNRNLVFEKQIEFYKEEKKYTEVLFEEFKERIEMLEEVVTELSTQY